MTRAPPAIDTTGERPLDTVEHVFALLAEVDACDGVVVLAVEGALTEEACRAAVRALPARHPRLATHLVRDGDARAFVAEGTAPIPFVVSPPSERAAWPAIVEAELSHALDPDALFRIRLVPTAGTGPHALVVHGHHAAADFLSMLRVGHDVCAMACGATLESVPPGLPLDRRLPERWSAPPETPDADVAMLPFRARASRAERAPRVAFRTVPSATLEALVVRARREEATLTGLLTVVATDALAAWPDAGWDHRGVRIGASISARRLCDPPVPEEELGCFVSQLEATGRLDGPVGPVWPRAREAGRTLKARALRGEWQAPLRAVANHLGGFGRKLRASADDDASQGRDTVLDVVSFGALAFPELKLRVTDVYGVVSQRGFGNCLQLSCGTWNGALCCSLGWTAPLVSDREAEAYFDRVVDALARAT